MTRRRGGSCRPFVAAALMLPSGAARAGDAVVVYASNTLSAGTPVERRWRETPSAWAPPLSTSATNQTMRWVVTQTSRTRSEFLSGVLSQPASGSDLDLLRFDGSTWRVDWSSTGIANSEADELGFDIAYENSSDRALAVYSDGTTNPRYRVWDGSNWTGGAAVFGTPPGTGTVQWVELADRSGSNEIALVYSDTNADLFAVIWDGTAWVSASTTTLETSLNTTAYRDFAAAYETTSGDLLTVWSQSGVAGFLWSAKPAGSNAFSAAATNANLGSGGVFSLASDPASNNIALAYIQIAACTNCDDFSVAMWNGSSWGSEAMLDTSSGNYEGRAGCLPVEAGWVGTSGTAVAVYCDSQTATLDWARWTSGGGWVLQSDVAVSGKGQTASAQLVGLSGQNKLLCVVSDSNSDLYAATYDGTSWVLTHAGDELENQLPSANGMPFSAATVRMTPGSSATATYTIGADNRDAMSLYSGSPTYEVRVSGYSGGDKRDYAGNDSEQETAAMAFAVSIPAGAVVYEAYAAVTASPFVALSSTGGLEIHAYDHATTPVFTNGNLGDLVNLYPTFSTTVIWPVPFWPSTSRQATPDLKALVQGFIDRGDYAPGNFLGLVMTEGTLGGNSYYGWEDFASGANSATLTVVYSSNPPGITLTQSGGSTAASESGPTSDSYTLVLASQPTANVTITVDPDAQTDLGSGAGVAVTLTFTPGNWNAAQTVTVTAVDDAVAEGAHTSTITHAVSSSDSSYQGFSVSNVTASLTDNDTAGVTLTQSGGSTAASEAGPTSDTYTLVLTSQPTANVTITVDPDTQTDLGGGAGATITKTFTSGNWNVAQTVTVTAVDDVIAEGAHTSTLTHSVTSTDSNYLGLSVTNVTANITDNDTAGVTVAESGGSTSISESGPTSDTYTLVLTSQPTASVSIVADPDAQTDIGAGAGAARTYTFTTANWNTPQTVTVTAVDDTVAEGAHTSSITHSSSSTDANYLGLSVAGVTASVTDNDVFGVTLAESGGGTSVSESGPTSDTYTLVLVSQPTTTVGIVVDPDVQTDVGAGAGTSRTLTFTTANWNTPQTVTVTAVDDAVVEGAHTSTLRHTSISGDASYNGLAISDVTAQIADNDSASGGGGGGGGGGGDAPRAYDQTLTLDEDEPASITLTGFTSRGSPLEYFVILSPMEGAVTGEPPDVTYTPAQDFSGEDMFRYVVFDGVETSAPATVNLTIEPVNDRPYAWPQEVTVPAGTTVDVTLIGLDADDSASLRYRLVGRPAHGTLSGGPPALTYTPDDGFAGDDELTYTIDDGVLVSEAIVVTLHVLGADDPPPDEGEPPDDGEPVEPDDGVLIADAGADVAARVGQTVHFDASASRIEPSPQRELREGIQIVLYAWDFDTQDAFEAQDAGVAVERVFHAPGEYAVTLRLYDSTGRIAEDALVCRIEEAPADPVRSAPCGIFNFGLMTAGLATAHALRRIFRRPQGRAGARTARRG